ncbi:polyprenyl synthetase family protein [Bacillus sp. J37]|uniref:polyprenyl synthetase family protein n=1 Tax=Bacillus sp. J37 TaxID=935837 RepID=UPI00047C5AA6|nr:polyprenyl synthetase family protein [Bacillus sp. J37]
MINTITSCVNNTELKNLLLSFLTNKEDLPFAQLTLIHYQSFGGNDEEITQLAAAVELLVLSFDMLDDLEDLDNVDEPWMKIEHPIALNAATTLYTLSKLVVLSLQSSLKYQIVEAFIKFSIQAMEGQHVDLKNSILTEEDCLEVMKNKSGSLIALASVSGMLLAGTNSPAVEEYSYQIGIAAQIDNDFRDLFNPLKNDVSSQKKSLAYLYLQKKYNDHAIEILEGFNSGMPINEYFGSPLNLKRKLIDAGVAQYLNVMKQLAINKATRMIRQLPINHNQSERLIAHLIIKLNPENKER